MRCGPRNGSAPITNHISQSHSVRKTLTENTGRWILSSRLRVPLPMPPLVAKLMLASLGIENWSSLERSFFQVGCKRSFNISSKKCMSGFTFPPEALLWLRTPYFKPDLIQEVPGNRAMQTTASKLKSSSKWFVCSYPCTL